ncbi:MAG: T9SS type A sorting domain-containing protein [Candidatus Delongbacteria bacterium]
MKKLLVAGLVLTVAGSALAATPQPSLDREHQKPVKKNLSSSLVRHTAPAQPLTTGTLGRTAPARPAKEGGPVVTPLNAQVLLGDSPSYPSAAHAEYAHLKANNLPIPASLIREVFGAPAQGGGQRQGGETWASAVAITFQAGGTYTDSGTTVGSVNDVPTGQIAPGLCNTSFFSTSSFGGGDVFYTFTLPGSYEVDASTCNAASYDSCLGIFDAEHNLVAVNDDGAGCSGFSSIIDPCCLEAGTYYVVVDGYGTANGTYDLTVNFSATTCSAGCPPIECDGTAEVEPNNGPIDFGGNDDFGAIECGETICGTTFTDDAAQTRDTDWYEILITENSILTINSEVELFDPLIFVLNSNYDIEYQANNFSWCEGESLTTDCMFPGTYYIWMGHSGFTGVPEEVGYSLSVSCETCTIDDPCADPVQLSCGDSITGTTVDGYDYVGNPALDKFFEVTIDQDGPITFSLCTATDYDSYLRIYDGCPVSGGTEIAFNDDACGLASEITTILTAGTYWVVVEGYSEGVGNFSLDIICSTCGEITCNGDDEGEPNNGPADFGGDDTYGSIECGIASTVCGTTWADADTRDTDWFELLLLEPSVLTITSEAELFDPLMFVLDDAYNIMFTADEMGFCEGETITTDCLPAGTYYLWMGHNAFAGVPDEVDYSLTLSCEVCEWQDPCENVVALECGETVTGESGMSVGNSWDTYCFGGEDGPEVLFAWDHTGGYIELTLASDAAEDLDMALLGSCDPLDCLDMPYAVGSEEVITGVYPAGTYYVVVDAYGYTGSDYSFDLTLFCGADPCENLPPVDCQGTAEVEPNEGWNDENATYGEITCGETVCGTTWATGGNRDLDWFHFTHTGGDIEVTTQIGMFDCILFLTDFDPAGAIIASADASPMCVAETITFAGLAAGEYHLVIAHNDFEGVDTDQDYALTLTCLGDPCEGHVPVQCDGTAEVEPNEGWNDDNASYNEIAEDETVCGSVWADGGSRDLDWYRFTVPGDEPMNVSLVAEIDEFDAIVFLLDYELDGATYTAANQNGPCQGETINYECLTPGDYYAVIAHTDFEGVPLDQNYSLTLTMAACTPVDPCEGIITGTWPTGYYTVTNHSAPTMNHHNAVNGCDGISSAGYDHLHMLTLAAPADIRFTMQGQGLADESIYVLTDCNFTESCIAGIDVGSSDAAPEVLEVADMPAGTYYFVADYWGASETHDYSMEVRNLTIAVDENGQPFAFELQGAFPNPFNPTTTIRWTQPELMPASLAIYNLAGQLVQQIDLGYRGPGVHNFVWNASQLSSGVYFTSLTTGGQTLTQKVVLLK